MTPSREAVLRRAEWCVADVPLASCRRLVAAEHYSQGGANTATFRHGLMRRAEPLRVVGIAWWLPPTRSAAEASWDGPWQQVLALSRLAIELDVPKNGASFLLGRSERLIRSDSRWRCLVTYADEWQGHTGAIYRAANWEYVGRTKPERTYVDAAGRMVARKAGPRTRTHAEMVELGYRCVGSFARHKFRKILPESRRRGDRLFDLEAA
jgi:hypothetical protein